MLSPMSRNNSVSTASTAHTTSLSDSTTHTSFSSLPPFGNHIISDFNPTLILHIPSHGALKKPRAAGVEIHDITQWLPGYNHNTSTIPDSVGVGDIRAVVAARRWSEGDVATARGKGGIGGVVAGSALVSRRRSRWSSRSTLEVGEGERGYGESAEWMVPWDIMKPSSVTLKGPGDRGEKRVELWCGKQDRRAQLWSDGGVTYIWRWAKPEGGGMEELVLEKEGGGMGSHRIGMFLFKHDPKTLNPLSPSSGTLVLDERGLARTIAVASILIFLKRDRQRRTVGGRT